MAPDPPRCPANEVPYPRNLEVVPSPLLKPLYLYLLNRPRSQHPGLSGRRDANDAALAPTTVRALQRCTHHLAMPSASRTDATTMPAWRPSENRGTGREERGRTGQNGTWGGLFFRKAIGLRALQTPKLGTQQLRGGPRKKMWMTMVRQGTRPNQR